MRTSRRGVLIVRTATLEKSFDRGRPRNGGVLDMVASSSFRWSWAAVGAFLLFIGGCAGSRVRDCRFYFEQKELEKSERCCDAVIAGSPGDADALFLKGRIEEIRADYAAMNRHYEASLAASGKHRNEILYRRSLLWTERFNEGADLFNRERYAQAAESFGAAATILPSRISSRVHLLVSRLLASGDDAGVLAEAEDDLAACPIDSIETAALNNLSLYYFRKGDWGRVIEIAGATLERDSLDATCLLRLAPALVSAGRLEEADRIYRRLVAHVPSFPQLYQDWGRVAYERGLYKEAVRRFNEALRLAGDDRDGLLDSYFYRGLSSYELGDYKAMAASFETLARRRPQDATVWRNLVVAYSLLDDPAAERGARERLRDLESSGRAEGE